MDWTASPRNDSQPGKLSEAAATWCNRETDSQSAKGMGDRRSRTMCLKNSLTHSQGADTKALHWRAAFGLTQQGRDLSSQAIEVRAQTVENVSSASQSGLRMRASLAKVVRWLERRCNGRTKAPIPVIPYNAACSWYLLLTHVLVRLPITMHTRSSTHSSKRQTHGWSDVRSSAGIRSSAAPQTCCLLFRSTAMHHAALSRHPICLIPQPISITVNFNSMHTGPSRSSSTE